MGEELSMVEQFHRCERIMLRSVLSDEEPVHFAGGGYSQVGERISPSAQKARAGPTTLDTGTTDPIAWPRISSPTTGILSAMAFHEKAGRSQVGSSVFSFGKFSLFPPSSHCRHASIRTLEERFVSLGAC